MSHTITRRECPLHDSPCSCGRPKVMRTYVAVDALLSDEAIDAAAAALAAHRTMPGPGLRTDALDALRAAVEAVKA